MSILVIGGAGYIGSHVVYELIRQKKDVIVLDDLSTGNVEAVHEKAKFYKGNQLDSNILDKIFLENKIDVVMHFSAKLIVPESVSKPIEYFENNVFGVIQLLKAMKKANVKNIVFSSTAAVYGDIKKMPIKEEDMKQPIQPYGMSKLSCEWLIQSASLAYGVNFAIFRYFNVAGADRSGEIGQSTKNVKELTHLIPVVMETILKIRKEMTVFGKDYDTNDGSCVRDYVHVTDLANAHILGAEFVARRKSGIFNLGSQTGFSVQQIIDATEKELNIRVNYKYGDRREGDPAMLVASNENARKVLGWKPRFSIEEIIRSDYAWRKDKKF